MQKKSEARRRASQRKSGDAISLLESNDENVKALSGSWQTVFDGWLELQNEAVEFGRKRVQENLDRNMALMRCRSIDEVFQVHCDFAHEANRQYLEQGSRLFAMAGQIGERSCQPIEQCAKQTLRDFASG